MRLHAGGDLHGVLGAAERQVGLGDLARLAVGDEAGGAQPAQAVERVAGAHPRLLAAPDELERLHEELGLADAARAELEIARGIGGVLRARALGQPDHLARDPRVDPAPPDEGREGREDLVAEGAIAGDGARAEERRPLPEAAERLVVALGRGERVDQRPAAPLGPQAQIDAPDEAVGGGHLEVRREAPGDAGPVVVEREGLGAAVTRSAAPSSVS